MRLNALMSVFHVLHNDNSIISCHKRNKLNDNQQCRTCMSKTRHSSFRGIQN